MTRRLTTLAVLLAAAATGHAADGPAKLADDARRVMKAHCHRCHAGEGSSSGYAFDVTRHATLVAKLGDEGPVVVAGAPDESPLVRAVQKRMPLKGAAERDGFGDAERAAIRKWVEAGAPPFAAAASGRKFLPLAHVLASVRDHLAAPANRDRKAYLRYFSLVNVHNDPRVGDDELRLHRAALSKALNSLSWGATVAVPVAIDARETVYAIDTRDLDWGAGRWLALVRAYPYGLRYGNLADATLADLDADARRLSGSELPWLRAAWFVATATRPPLYHDLLGLPRNARDLEATLGVDVAANFRDDKLARGGFQVSGVSEQNRLMERHPAKYGAYWKSYDFLPDSGRADLTRFPLGPAVLTPGVTHPHAGQAFRHDGGEVIFHLPNGLQAYLLVNGKDERIDAGPIDVVNDNNKTSGTPAIVNGVSCMACHKRGMLDFTDTVRATSAVFGDADEKVRRLYPEKPDMDRLVARYRKRFLDSLAEATGPFLKVGPDAGKPVADFPEPVSTVAGTYRRERLTLAAVATEFYVETPGDLLVALGERRLKELGLERLRAPGGVVARLRWEATDEGNSLMQDVARELRYTPYGR